MLDRFKNLGGHGRLGRSGCPIGSGETGQISLFWVAQESSAAVGCPIAFQQAAEFDFLPEGGADQGEEPGEAVRPPAQKDAKAQQHIGEQGGPDLPADGVGTVAEEVRQVEGLFEFLEEALDAPAAAVEIGDGLGTPLQIIGQENHFAEFAVHLDPGRDAAQFDRISFLGLAGEGDEVVTQNVAALSLLKFAGDPGLEVILGAGDPEDFAHGKVGEMGEVQISPVEEDDFTRLNIGAQLAGAAVVMFGGGVQDDAAWQEGLEVEAEMAFGGGFAPTMFGPVQRAGHQLNGGRVHDLDEPLETEGKTRTVVAAEGRLDRLQMFHHRPEKFFSHDRITGAVGVRERVLGRRCGPPQGRQRSGVQAQSVAHVVEAETVRDLGVEQADDVTPRTKRPGVFVHAGLPGQLRHQVRWNEVAKLAQQRKLAGRWLTLRFVFHPCLVAGFKSVGQLFYFPNPLTLRAGNDISSLKSADLLSHSFHYILPHSQSNSDPCQSARN